MQGTVRVRTVTIGHELAQKIEPDTGRVRK
jgi:hypothetical protein